jgi:hypothetical protein
MNRFTYFTGFFLTVSFLLLPATQTATAQEDLRVIYKWRRYSDASNSLYHHICGQAYQLLEKRAGDMAGLESLSAWKRRQEVIRETLMDIVGPFPEKSPLNARITGTVQKDGYRVEHILYESQPGFHVTSSLFIPASIRGKAPAVIYCSGHSALAYRNPVYQRVILNLVKKGFVVFAFDPVGQGERLEYYDPETGASKLGGSTKEHSYPGAQAFITGSSQARYMIWDGIRAVDYLLTREEVDPSRIGITGRSGGGTQSAYISAFDERIRAAAPECYITNFTRLLQSIGPQDAEQNLCHGIFRGIDHADFLLVRAPRPALMLTTTGDFFSIQGARETAAEVAGIYRAYGREDHFGMVEDDAGHESTKRNREAMYAFFQEHLDNPGDPADLDVETLSDEELRVTPTGQLSTSLKGETVFSLNRREAQTWNDALQTSRKGLAGYLPRVRQWAEELSGFIEPVEVHEPVYAGGIRKEGYAIEKYFVRGEGDYVIPYLLMIPRQSNGRALIYLHPSGKAAAVPEGGEAEWFVNNGFTVLLPDMIGVGELGRTDARGDAVIGGVSHNVWYASMLIGRSITGIRAGDVVRLARLLEKKCPSTGINAPAGGDIHGLAEGNIYGLARGNMSPVLLHAATHDSSIARVALIEPLSSYRSIVMNRYYNSEFIHGTVPGALQHYDLPDLAACLAPRKLLMTGIADGMGNPADPEHVSRVTAVIRAAYELVNATGQLEIAAPDSTVDMHELFRDWTR